MKIRFENKTVLITDPCYVIPTAVYDTMLGNDWFRRYYNGHSKMWPHNATYEGINIGWLNGTNIGDGCWSTYSVDLSSNPLIISKIGGSAADAGLTGVFDLDALIETNKIVYKDSPELLDNALAELAQTVSREDLVTKIENFTGVVDLYTTESGFTWVLESDGDDDPTIIAGDFDLDAVEVPKNSYWATNPESVEAPGNSVDQIYFSAVESAVKDMCLVSPPTIEGINTIWTTEIREDVVQELDEFIRDRKDYGTFNSITKEEYAASKDLYLRLGTRFKNRIDFAVNLKENQLIDPVALLMQVNEILKQWKESFDTSIVHELQFFKNVENGQSYVKNIKELEIFFLDSIIKCARHSHYFPETLLYNIKEFSIRHFGMMSQHYSEPKSLDPKTFQPYHGWRESVHAIDIISCMLMFWSKDSTTSIRVFEELIEWYSPHGESLSFEDHAYHFMRMASKLKRRIEKLQTATDK